MTHRKDVVIPLLNLLSDVCAIEASFLLSYWLRFYSPLTDVFAVDLGFPPLDAYIYGSLVVIPAWIFLFYSRGMYAPRRTVHFSDDFFPIVKVVLVGMLIVMSATFLYREFSFSRLVFAFIGLLSIVLISGGRYFVLMLEHLRYRMGKDIRDVVLVGTNETALRVCEAMTNDPSLGLRLVGYFSASPRQTLRLKNIQRLGTTKDVHRFLTDRSIDLVLFALTPKEHSQLYELVEECQGLNVEMMMAPDLIEIMTSRVRVQEIKGIPFIQVREPSLTIFGRMLKRSFDIVVAFVALILALPFFFILGIVIKATSEGPILYLQERVGLDGKLFRVMKFRTMRTNAEKETGPVWARKDDPRVTSVGRILRRFSLDELPQLLNVLKGEMSLVGPRPERQHFVNQFKDRIPKYLDRHRVKTGMTGWAQVNGLRGNASIEERTRYDVYYVENWSLVFDLKIILKTLRAVLFGEDAY